LLAVSAVSGTVEARQVARQKEVTMHRVVAAVLAVLLTGALGVGGALAQMPKGDSAQPKSMDQQKSMGMNADKRVEGTIKSVQGSTVTLDDGTTLAIPSSVQVSRDQLKPGAMIVAEYQERGGQKVATSVHIKG
jgi:hypothetical protein